MWNKTTYPFLVQALCIIPLKSIRMWASFVIFIIIKTFIGCFLFKSKAGTVDCSGFTYIRLMNYYFFTEEGV